MSQQAKPPHSCAHCGTTATPCWRKGPAEKPILCNACGARYLVKNSLDGYFPGSKVSAAQRGPTSLLQNGVAKKPRVPKILGLKQKAGSGDSSRLLSTQGAVKALSMAYTAGGWTAPATDFINVAAIDEPLHVSSGQSSDSDGSMDGAHMYRRASDMSMDSQDAGEFSSGADTVIELLHKQGTVLSRPASSCAARFYRSKPRKQAHPMLAAL